MKKRILAALLCLSLTAGLAVPAYAEEAPEETGFAEEAAAAEEEAAEEPEPLDALEAESSALEARSGEVAYAVEGGNIYFDPSSEEIVGFDGDVTRAEIPSEIDGVRVIGIGDYAFYGCSSLTSVTIPSSVTSIGRGAFMYCGGLADIYYTGTQSQWDAIRKDAYNDDLVTVDIHYNYGPSTYPVTGVTLHRDTLGLTVGGTAQLSAEVSPEHAYNKNVTWTSSAPDVVSVSDGTVTAQKTGRAVITVTTEDGGKTASLTVAVVTGSGKETSDGSCGEDLIWILDANGTLTVCGSGAMLDYSNYILDEGVPWYGFRDSIERVSIEPGVTSIGNYTFWDCSKLTSVTIPESVAKIGSYAFRRCRSLTSITIPGAVTSIGDYAFESCSDLTSVNIPQGVTSIGSYAFNYCGKLTSVNIPQGVTNIGSFAFSSCSSLVSIVLPDSVTSIGNSAFWGCSSLTSITIPDHITSIEGFVFAGCSGLTSVNIPQSVTSIGRSAFSSCESLKDVSYAGSAKQWKAISIGGDNDALTSATIHYNSGAGETAEAKLIPSSSSGSTVRLTGGTLPGDAQVFAAHQEGGRFAGAALGTRSGDQITFNCLLAEGDKLFFLSEDFIPLAPAVRIAA